MSSSKTADQANYLTLAISTKPLSEHGVRISSRTANQEVRGESQRGVRISGYDQGVRISSGVRISDQHGMRISGHDQGVRISSRKRGQLLSTAA